MDYDPLSQRWIGVEIMEQNFTLASNRLEGVNLSGFSHRLGKGQGCVTKAGTCVYYDVARLRLNALKPILPV